MLSPKGLAVVRAVFMVVAVLALSAISVSLWGGRPERQHEFAITHLTEDMTAAQIANLNGIPMPVVLKVMGIDSSLALVATPASVSITIDEARPQITRAWIQYDEHRSKNWGRIALKFGLWFLILPIPFWLMVRRRMTPPRRRWLYGVSTTVFGVALGADPSPMGTVKDALFLLSAHQTVFWPRIIALAVFLLIVVLANKFICAWGCQFGVLQDFIFRLGRKSQDRSGLVRQVKAPFVVTDWIRNLVLAAIIVVGWLSAFDFVDVIDPFKVFSPAALTTVGTGFIVLVLVSSLFIYRPWCHFACPFGKVSLLFERISVFRVKVDYGKCTACDACSQTCPSTVMEAILKQHRNIPDCFACGVCIETCPTGAISFSASRRPTGSWEEAVTQQAGMASGRKFEV